MSENVINSTQASYAGIWVTTIDVNPMIIHAAAVAVDREKSIRSSWFGTPASPNGN
jgi:hypothetical protein